MMTFVILAIILAIDDRFLGLSIYLVSFLALAMIAVFIWGSVVIIGKLNSG